MVTVHGRGLHVWLALTDTVTDPLPVPLIGVTVTQLLHGLVTVQVQSLLLAVRFTIVLPPSAGGLQFGGLIVNELEPAA